MTLLAGRCVFSEGGGRPGARVFVLCERQNQAENLIPISTPGESGNVKGVTLSGTMGRLTIQISRLPRDIVKMHFGLSIPAGRHLGVGEPMSLHLLLESGDSASIPLRLPPGQIRLNYRYAILAFAEKRQTVWSARGLKVPRLYVDRGDVGHNYRLPPWWTSSRL